MRVAGWEQALVEAIERHVALPFSWGVSDCAVLTTDCIAAVTGERPFGGPFRYRSEIGAAKWLRRKGLDDLAALGASRFEECPPSLARRGDIGMIERDGKICAGVFTSQGFVSKAERGIIAEPVTAVARAFRID
ncbi:DUF6950 family protein [Aureimonas leprariae]|uniref:DUF6950 domain-containing protein n=1 Tax=Plantimonas leprariae TaxID=2615207 RepID=A0A7V7TXX9_9HYPH|nr:hypothetical protein [Aureimonas leprariae]KAB0682016.1 hypothetical protein F6X38_04205 [Aureimonas leprariae]